MLLQNNNNKTGSKIIMQNTGPSFSLDYHGAFFANSNISQQCSIYSREIKTGSENHYFSYFGPCIHLYLSPVIHFYLLDIW